MMEQLITFAENNAMLSMAWLAIVSMLVFITIKSKLSPVKEINTQELTLKVNREDAQVIDIRSEADFKKGHILGSKHLTVEKVNNNQLQGLENAKDKPIIVVCTAGMTALPVARKLLKAGFTQVSSLKGGFSGWQSANLPVTK